MLGHVLLAVDGSPGSRRAADFARTLVAGTTTRLTVLLVLEPPSAAVIPVLEGVAYSPPHPAPDELVAAQALIAEIEAELGHGHAGSRVEVGHPAEVITRVATELGVDLVVLGARGQNLLERLLLGSVSERVTRQASQPVTVVR